MAFPMGFQEISLLLAFTAIVLLITSEVLSPRYGKVNIFVSKRRLRASSLVFSAFFLVTVAVNLFQIILNL